ncbi:TonB-dependent receptor plug domain-containing protein, partial [Flavobacterium sp. 3-210]
DTTTLQEVRVNAGYYSVKESDRTGSIARITSKDIENQPVTNVFATMQGRMSGVNITQNTGMPGGGFAIQIRGQNSIRNDGNDPLYI